MVKRNKVAKKEEVTQGKNASDEAQLRFWKGLIGEFHDGISQLTGKSQDLMLQKHAKACVDTALDTFSRITGRDATTFNVDEMIKVEEDVENWFAKGKASINREGNVITWKSNLPYCYDPKIENGMIKPYPAYCKQCDLFFEGLYRVAHKGPVKVKNLKSVFHGDTECITSIELL